MTALLTVLLVALLMGATLLGFLFLRLRDRLRRSEEDARRLLEQARLQAETLRKEAELQARAEILKTRSEAERETQEKTQEFRTLERRLGQKEEALDRRQEQIDRREEAAAQRERAAQSAEAKAIGREQELEGALVELRRRLEAAAAMSAADAKAELVKMVLDEARHEASKEANRIEAEATATAAEKARKIMADAIQRYAGEYTVESTVSVVTLPNDDMKGRIIGREGRNIRAIEAATGVDLIIDDTPEVVVVSALNPVRREVAKRSIEKLVQDGRIHPARIEEIVQKTGQEVEQDIHKAGEKAAMDCGLHGVHNEILKLLGRLQYRRSYSQNVYTHSMEVAFLSGLMAGEMGLNVKMARRVGLLHDLGKAVDHEVEGPHALIGADLARKFGEAPRVVEGIAGHHDDHPASLYAVLASAADAISAARPGARREMMETYVKRVEELERIAAAFPGVDKAYAVQAGRELRVIVESEKISDAAAGVLSRDIARKIESEMTFPGQIRVTVIRETRAVEIAR